LPVTATGLVTGAFAVVSPALVPLAPLLEAALAPSAPLFVAPEHDALGVASTPTVLPQTFTGEVTGALADGLSADESRTGCTAANNGVPVNGAVGGKGASGVTGASSASGLVASGAVATDWTSDATAAADEMGLGVVAAEARPWPTAQIVPASKAP
jgi:hypothetical protein